MTLNIPNLDRLISHLEGLPEEKFNIRSLFEADGVDTKGAPVEMHSCGTAACIAGAAYWAGGFKREHWGAEDAAHWLGLKGGHADRLFLPAGFLRVPEEYPLSRAIRTLKHMRSEYPRTGEIVVDWDAPEPVEKTTWAAPKAVERVLPEEIVSLLRPAQRAEVSA